MKSKDTVHAIGNELYTHFAGTGHSCPATTVDLSRGVSVFLDGNSLVASTPAADGHARVVLETFESNSLARNAFEDVRCELVRRNRVRRITGFTKNMAKYVVAPLGLVLFGLALNVSVHGNQVPAQAAAIYGAAGPMPSLPATPLPPLPTQPAAVQLTVPPSKVAAALQAGVKAGKFTVKLGSAKGDPIYAFEDPLCGHCQELAPELNKLAKTHPVYVFPVSVIGGDDSLPVAATALCADDREKAWTLAIAGNASIGVTKPNIPQAACFEAVKANDAIFGAIGMQGTPTIFNATGERFPTEKVQPDAQKIETWLKAG